MPFKTAIGEDLMGVLPTVALYATRWTCRISRRSSPRSIIARRWFDSNIRHQICVVRLAHMGDTSYRGQWGTPGLMVCEKGLLNWKTHNDFVGKSLAERSIHLAGFAPAFPHLDPLIATDCEQHHGGVASFEDGSALRNHLPLPAPGG
jgi:hypothetical protein